MAGQTVNGELYYDLDGQLLEIKRQLRQRDGYPYDASALRDHLQRAIEGRFTVQETGTVSTATSTKLDISKRWRRTIRVGGMETDALLAAVKKASRTVSDDARNLTSRPGFTTSANTEEVELISLTPRDLGFTKDPRTDEFMTAELLAAWSAKYLDGYVIELCQPEDGPQLGREYEDQPCDETLWMAMERILGSGGYPGVFYLRRDSDGQRWLNSYWANPDSRWRLGPQLVFRLRKLVSA